MNILILTSGTGGGHNSAAKAIKQALTEQGHTCTVTDCLVFTRAFRRRFIVQGHNLLYRYAPKMYGLVYRVELSDAVVRRQIRMFDSAIPKLIDYVEKGGFDAVVCVHVFGAVMLTQARRKYSFSVRQYMVVTDYTCSPGLDIIDMDCWFVPHGLRAEFESHGIPADRIVETGIPVRREFVQNGEEGTDGTGGNEVKIALGIGADTPLAVISAGEMGVRIIRPLSVMIERNCPGAAVAVVCGTNRNLYRRLSSRRVDGKFVVLPYTDRMDRLLGAADVFVTKGGGLSITEGATSNVPLVLVNAVPGLEPHNIDFFVKNGFALTSSSLRGISDAVSGLLENGTRAKKIRSCQKKCFSDYAAGKIAEFVDSYGQ